LLDNQEYKDWANNEVSRQEFWEENYLSTDRRLPVSLVKTNAARALATNGLAGNVYQDFSSESYKALPAVDLSTLLKPLGLPNETVAPRDGGRGYYRPASLVSIWATAPLLHNNSVGIFNNDPSVDGRVRAFKDAIEKLLARGPEDEEAAARRWRLGSDQNGATPERLTIDHGLIWRLPQRAWIRIPASQLPYLVAWTLDIPLGIIQRPWLVPGVIVIGAAVLIMTRWRLIRYAGYVLLVTAFAAGFATFFVAGYLSDLSLGPLPAGLPVDAVANIDPSPARPQSAVAIVKRAYRAYCLIRKIDALPADSKTTQDKHDKLVGDLDRLLREVSKSPDVVMDRGHYFGAALTDEQRRDLIDLLLTF
jgi:hypothetical protein